jgi:hypothetical protein
MCQCPDAHPFIKSIQSAEFLRSTFARAFIAGRARHPTRGQIGQYLLNWCALHIMVALTPKIVLLMREVFVAARDCNNIQSISDRDCRQENCDATGTKQQWANGHRNFQG